MLLPTHEHPKAYIYLYFIHITQLNTELWAEQQKDGYMITARILVTDIDESFCTTILICPASRKLYI